MTSNLFWLMALMLGPVVLGGAIVYAPMRQRRLSPDEERRSDAAANKLYTHDEKADARPLGARQ